MTRTWRARGGAICAAAGVLLIGLAIQGPSATAAVNSLANWTKQGAASAGTWMLSGDGTSVTQTIDGAPTFFVSPFTKSEATFTVDITPAQSADSDWVGVVLGYRDPLDATSTACETSNCQNSYILLDWKQADEGAARAGFSLIRVTGSFDVRTKSEQLPCFGDHVDNNASCDVLATNFGTNLGWSEGQTNTLKFTYGPGNIKVENVGSQATSTIFDVPGAFPAGRIGLYNYSQAAVTYDVNDLAEPAATTTTTSSTTTTTTVPVTTTSSTVARTSTTRAPLTLPATVVHTGPDDRTQAVQLTLGALLIVVGAIMAAARGRRPSGRFYS